MQASWSLWMHLALETEYLMSATSKLRGYCGLFLKTEWSDVLESDFHAAFKILAWKVMVVDGF